MIEPQFANNFSYGHFCNSKSDFDNCLSSQDHEISRGFYESLDEVSPMLLNVVMSKRIEVRFSS